jgi:glycosyltransferase involved in cell wall biosynthesis
MKVMIWNAAKGGMRSVVEGYVADGFISGQDIRLIHSYDDSGFVSRQFLLLRALSAYVLTLLTHKVDLVHVHSAMRGSFWRKSLFLIIARWFSIPVIFHLHGSEMKAFYAEQSPKGRDRIRWVFEHAARVIVLSESWRTYIDSIAPKARITVVHNYVSVPEVAKPDNASVQIVFLGLVGKRKGVADLIQAMARVHAIYPDARLTIGGNGEVAQAEAQVKALGIDECIELAGWVGPEQRARLLSAADIYVLPSYNEGLPMGILEAMAYKAAVVSTTVGGIPELISDGENGRLIAPGDVDGLAEALLALAGDATQRRRLAANAHATLIASYSNTAVLPVLDALYADTVAEGRAA